MNKIFMALIERYSKRAAFLEAIKILKTVGPENFNAYVKEKIKSYDWFLDQSPFRYDLQTREILPKESLILTKQTASETQGEDNESKNSNT